MLTPLIAFFSFWGVVFCALVFVIMIACSENDSPLWGLFWFVAFLVFITLFTSDARPLEFVQNNWLLVLCAIPIYIGLGAVWGLFRWRLYVRDPKNYPERKIVPGKPLKIDDYRRRVITWMTLWLPNAIWFPLRRLQDVFAIVFNHLRGTLQRIADNAAS